jgi:hypothetical protein
VKNEPFLIRFLDTSLAQANLDARSLAESVKDVGPNLSAEVVRESPETLDFGASVAIILGTASVTAIANGIARWLARNAGAKIEIRQDGAVLATNLNSTDAAKIAQAFSQKR